MKYLVQHRMPVQVELCEKATKIGSLLVVMYLYSHHLQFSPHINFIGLTAVQYDQVECLKYAVERGCEVNTELCRAALAVPGSKCLEYLITSHPTVMLTEKMFAHACRTDVLMAGLLHAHGCPVHPIAVEAAAAGGSEECLKFLCDLGFDCWLPSTMAAAARADDLPLVIHLCFKSCPWDETAIWAAKRGRSNLCLKYLSRICCPAQGICKKIRFYAHCSIYKMYEWRMKEKSRNMPRQCDELHKRYDKLERVVAMVERAIDKMGKNHHDALELHTFSRDVRTAKQEIKSSICCSTATARHKNNDR